MSKTSESDYSSLYGIACLLVIIEMLPADENSLDQKFSINLDRT